MVQHGATTSLRHFPNKRQHGPTQSAFELCADQTRLLPPVIRIEILEIHSRDNFATLIQRDLDL